MQTPVLDEGAPMAPRRADSKPLRIALIVAASLAAVGLGLIVATLNRGFDWTDEGFVYTMIASNRVAEGEVWGFQHLLHPLYALFGDSVLAFRVLRLIGYVALSVVLVLAARSISSRLGLVFTRGQWIFILLIAQIGTFAPWGYPPRYLGYNEVASWLAQAGGVLLLILLTDLLVPPSRGAWRTAGIWSALGLVTATLALVKISSGVIFAVLVLTAALVPTARFAWWKRAGSVAIGGALGLGVLWAAGYPLTGYLSSAIHLLTDSSAQEASDHSLSAIVSTYLGSLEHTLGLIVVPVALIILVALVMLRSSFAIEQPRSESVPARDRMMVRGLWLLAIVIAVAAFVIPAGSVWNQIGATVALLGAAGAAILVLIGNRLIRVPDSAERPRTVLIVGATIVALTPFISAVGTNNPILGQTLFSATTWAVLFGFALCALFVASPSAASARGIPLALGAASLAIFLGFLVTDVFVQPYRTVPYFQQSDAVTSGPLRGIRVTAEEAALVRWLETEREALSAADVPTAAISAAGALLNFNQSGWANPWIDAMWPVSFSSVELACKGGVPADLIVLQPDSETAESASYLGFVDALGECGLEFPEDFEQVSQTPSNIIHRPMTIWRLED